MDRSRILRKAAVIGICGNALLAGLKIAVGFIAGSYAVVGDGIDSSADVLSFFLTLLTARLIVKQATLKFPYGFQKAENIATKALSFIIFFAGIQFLISAFQRLFDSEGLAVPGNLAIAVTLISIFGKLALAAHQKKLGKSIESELLIANARNMQNDVLISVSVLLGLVFTVLLHLPILDLIIAILVGFWIIRVGVKIFLESNVELMDGVSDPEIYVKIFNAVDTVKEAHNPHRLRTRKIANSYIIALDVEVDGNLSIDYGHKIAVQVEEAIRANIDKVFDILIHIEPRGNRENEASGITRENVKDEFPQLKDRMD